MAEVDDGHQPVVKMEEDTISEKESDPLALPNSRRSILNEVETSSHSLHKPTCGNVFVEPFSLGIQVRKEIRVAADENRVPPIPETSQVGFPPEQSSSSRPHGAMLGNGRFMDAFRVFQVMLHRQPTGTSVPSGIKENVYFLLNNAPNILRRGKGKMCRYMDDCGAWTVNASCKSHHYVIRGEQLDSVELRDGSYCKELKGVKVPLSPQPSEDELITFKRYYVSLKRCPMYRRRVSTIAVCPRFLEHLKNLVVVEYTGLFPSDNSYTNEDPLKTSSKNGSRDQPKLNCSGYLTARQELLSPGDDKQDECMRFLEANDIFEALLTKLPIGQDIPAGVKENVYFVIDNGLNIKRRANGKKSRYRDDCGIWSVQGKSKYLDFVIHEELFLEPVDVMDKSYPENVRGDHSPVVTQPTEENLISFRQYLVHLKDDTSYRKRVTVITKCPEALASLRKLALVEYCGKWPIPSTDPRLDSLAWNQENGNKEEFVVCSPDLPSLNESKPDRSVRTEGIPLEKGRFMNADDIFKTMMFRIPIGDTVPEGTKENVCFLIDDEENITRRANGKKRKYSDDYGVWSIRPSSDTDYYYIREDGHLTFMNLVNGVYCTNVKRNHTVLDPQPTDENVIVFSRYRASLKGDAKCRKRITTVLKCPEQLAHIKGLAVVEYVRLISKAGTSDADQSQEDGGTGDDVISIPESYANLKPISSQDVIHNHYKYLDGNTVYQFFLHGKPVSRDVLHGRKENLYFICYIDPDMVVETLGKKCPYEDDAGTWVARPSCKTHRYIITEDDDLDYVDLKGGIYHKDTKGVRVPLDPQPGERTVITFKRFYGILKRNPNYKRRVSIVVKCPSEKDHFRSLAVVEYIGSLYG